MTTFNQNLTSAVLAILASGSILVFTAGPVHAATVSVSAPAHELATSNGRAKIEKRVVRAAEQVCGLNGQVVLAERSVRKACVADAVADARSQIASAMSATQLASR